MVDIEQHTVLERRGRHQDVRLNAPDCSGGGLFLRSADADLRLDCTTTHAPLRSPDLGEPGLRVPFDGLARIG